MTTGPSVLRAISEPLLLGAVHSFFLETSLAPARKTFHFSILETASAWRWQALDSTGVVVESGLAPSRRFAAACIIRALAPPPADAPCVATAHGLVN